MVTFDDLDMKILAVLIDDASISVPKLSNQINVNTSVVYSRIKRLVKKGLIERFTLELDESLLGFPVRAIIGCNIDSKKRTEIINEIRGLAETREILEVTGRFDLMIVVRARSLEELHQFISQRMGQIDGVRYTETFIEMQKRTRVAHYISDPKISHTDPK